MSNIDDYKEHIFIDSNVHFGKPCIVGTRIPVENVLELIQENIPFDVIINNYYSDLTVEDIKACVKYAIEIVRVEEIHIKAM